MLGNDLLIDLREAAACDRRRTGSKAAVLAVLLQAGGRWPVVEGVVLMAEASRRSASASDGSAAAELPDPVREALRQVAERNGDTPVAVRSSALAEDLPQATFAGQYETVLDVSGLTALGDAVRRCWQSLNDPGTEVYRRWVSADEDHAMAVPIQQMVRPVASGVALGADPITGDRGKVLVSTVSGYTARLVSGKAVNEDWEITQQGAVCRDCHGEVLAADQAFAVAQLVHREAACRQAFATQPRQQARFSRLLDLAQRYAALRADQRSWFTLGWSLLRRCAHRLGRYVSLVGLIGDPEDVFFLRRAELGDCLTGQHPEGLSSLVRQRRAEWERQCQIPAPLALGKPPILLAKLLLPLPQTSHPPSLAAGSRPLRGTPASPGRGIGPVRILRDPAEVSALAEGDVLFVAAAVPALTSVFGRIVALCVDRGSVAVHASLIAREYGIPAVAGLGDATTRFTDGIWVTVNGIAGTIEPWTSETGGAPTGAI